MNPASISYSMDIPLLLSSLLHNAARHHRNAEIVSVIDGQPHRYGYADCEWRARRVVQMLTTLGVGQGDRVGTLAWNDHRHLELYFGISGMGAICHTVNPRLFTEQILHIVNDAQDRIVIFSPDFLPLVTEIAPLCPSVESWIMLGDPKGLTLRGKPVLDFEALLAAQTDDTTWPVLDERSAAFLCYTSGTTGQPKGVVYSHRATVLHAYACALPDSHNVSAREVVMPVVPMFHANAWEAPFSATLTGAKLVLPGSRLDGESLYRLIEQEGVTFSIGVPTVWFTLLRYMQERQLRFTTLRRLLLGGAATPPSMIDAYAALGVELYQGWGMTETAALTTCAQPLRQHATLTPDEQRRRVFGNAGRVVAGADMRIVDEQGNELPWGEDSAGHFQVRAPWAITRYYGATQSALSDGWLPTGDIATIDADGYMRLTDRNKDVVKSGGEWISSVEIENIAVSCPGVRMAACIAATHHKWGERPVLIVQRDEQSETTAEQVLAFFQGKVAKWWIPDAVVFVDDMPLTATGKLFKLKLREAYGNTLIHAG